MFNFLVQPTSWDEAAEKKLATIYKETEQSKKPVKSKWKTIAVKMNNKYSAEKCRLKIKNLKDRYMRIKKQNNKSGESPSDDPMEEFLGDIFESQPDVDPDYVIDSDKGSLNGKYPKLLELNPVLGITKIKLPCVSKIRFNVILFRLILAQKINTCPLGSGQILSVREIDLPASTGLPYLWVKTMY